MTTAKVTETAAGAGEASTKLKTCSPAVCVGGAQPTSCVCPITPKNKSGE